ncbi:MAG: domain S-box protein [Ferruginibacter sp.]|nr:domain S-box protein [Ferruginibacter sp.]
MLEGDTTIARLTIRLLFKENLNCVFNLAMDKDAYLQALGEFNPTVIVSGSSLPEFNSEAACAIARQRLPDIPFIVIIEPVSEEFVADIINIGVDDYILRDRIARLPAAIITAIEKRKTERQKRETEEIILRSEANLRVIFENTSEGFLLLDSDGIIIAFNNKATRYTLFGRGKEFKIGLSIYDLIEKSQRDFFQEIIAKAFNGESIQYDRCYEMEKGNIVWIDFSVTPVVESNQVKGICITGRDITERKKNEQEREFDRNNLRALINNTSDPMWSVDRDFKLITSNDAFDNMMKAISGKTVVKGSNLLKSGFSKEQLNRFREYYERAFSGESFKIIEHAAFPEDAWSEISFYSIFSGVTIIGVACSSRDITRRKKAEREIVDYKNALDQSCIVTITDEKGIIQYANDNFCKISGYSAAELVGQNHRIVKSGYHPEAFMKDLWATVSDGKIWRGELCNKAKTGTLYWVDATFIPFLNDQDKPVQYIEISNDITEKKLMAEEIVEQKIQEQKKIVRTIIKAREKERNHVGLELHDNINQLLASAKMSLCLTAHVNEEINDLIKYPIELIDNTMEEIRLLCSNLVTPLKNVDLEELVWELLRSLDPNEIIKKKFTYSVSNSDSKRFLSADLKLNIYRIIQEQMNNILKYSEAKNVDISIKVEGNTMKVSIVDDGKGFDVKRTRHGIGISNMISRIETYNGKVSIISSLGKGCRISIKIPG